jgi:hypothetical protein
MGIALGVNRTRRQAQPPADQAPVEAVTLLLPSCPGPDPPWP